jgi:hypothetical protein
MSDKFKVPVNPKSTVFRFDRVLVAKRMSIYMPIINMAII